LKYFLSKVPPKEPENFIRIFTHFLDFLKEIGNQKTTLKSCKIVQVGGINENEKYNPQEFKNCSCQQDKLKTKYDPVIPSEFLEDKKLDLNNLLI